MVSALLRSVGVIAVIACMPLPALAAEQTDTGTADKATLGKVFPSKPGYSPYAGRTFPTMPLFGDTHLHTAYSMDAVIWISIETIISTFGLTFLIMP